MIAVHVDDVFFDGASELLHQTEDILRTSRGGTAECLAPGHPIAFLGIRIERANDNSVLVSQSRYIAEMPKMNPKEYIFDHGQIVDVAKYRTAAKQALRSLIWIHQTRPDVGYNITKIATDAVNSRASGDLSCKLIAVYNKTLRYLRNHDREIRYTNVTTVGMTAEQLWGNLMMAKIIAFSDAGFESSDGSHIIEGTFVILGQVISRDGIINCIGQMLDRRCAKIHRVCRSSIAAEAHAAVAACDQALWLQMLMTEITTGTYDIRIFCPPTEYPLQNPFSPAPSNEQVHRDLDLKRPKMHGVVKHPNANLNVDPTTDRKLTDFGNPKNVDNGWKKLPALSEPILLIDSCSLFTAVLRIQPRSDDKCAKITPNHLRDLQKLLRISYIDAPTNLADAETKHGGSSDILSKFMIAGRFDVSFVGRRHVGEMKKSSGSQNKVI